MGCVVPNFFITTRWKNTKVSLIIHPPLTLLWGNRIGRETWSGTGRNQSRTPYTTARSHGSRKCPAPLQFSLWCAPLSLRFSPQLSLSSSIASSPSSPPPRHLPVLTPDTVPPLRFHPFPTQPACCGGCVVALSFWLHILSPAFLTPTSALRSGLIEMDLSPPCWLSAVCVCVWESAWVSASSGIISS